jgi:ubiquinone/menaquinone biosynthesis C-methylase UbiE
LATVARWHVDTLTELYDEFAPDYERTRVPRFRPFVKQLLRLYDTRPGSHVLDAGCGTGLAATMVAPRVGHSGRVLGVDLSPRMLEIARHKAHGYGFDQCEFVLGDMAHLDVAAESFDVVICSFALWRDPHALAGEFLRVLKPGGALLLQNWTSDRDGALAAYDSVASRYLDSAPSDISDSLREVRAQNREWWNTLQTPEAYVQLLREAGFSSARAEPCALPLHFSSSAELVEFQNLTVWRRRPLARLDPALRNRFLADAESALRPFETAKGIDVESRAIQVVALK